MNGNKAMEAINRIAQHLTPAEAAMVLHLKIQSATGNRRVLEELTLEAARLSEKYEGGSC